MLSEIWARARLGRERSLIRRLASSAGDFALDERLAFAVLVFPSLHGQVAGLGEGGADVGVLGGEGGGVEVDFHKMMSWGGATVVCLRQSQCQFRCIHSFIIFRIVKLW